MSQLSPKPAILLLHGAWHVPQHHAAFISQLESRGFTVSCPRLPSCNDASPPNKTLDDDVWCARKVALDLMNRRQDVVVVMHSYGGVVGTYAMSGLHESRKVDGNGAGRVTSLIYMSAFVPFESQSLAGLFGGQLPPWLTSNPDTENVDIDDPQWHFYNDLPKEQRDHWAHLLVRHPVTCQYDPVQDPELKAELGERVAWRDVENIAYIICRNDEALPDFVQQVMVDRLEVEGGLGKGTVRVESLDSGHSPFLSVTDELVGTVQRLM